MLTSRSLATFNPLLVQESNFLNMYKNMEMIRCNLVIAKKYSLVGLITKPPSKLNYHLVSTALPRFLNETAMK